MRRVNLTRLSTLARPPLSDSTRRIFGKPTTKLTTRRCCVRWDDPVPSCIPRDRATIPSSPMETPLRSSKRVPSIRSSHRSLPEAATPDAERELPWTSHHGCKTRGRPQRLEQPPQEGLPLNSVQQAHLETRKFQRSGKERNHSKCFSLILDSRIERSLFVTFPSGNTATAPTSQAKVYGLRTITLIL